ncbi:DUF423 domain-containing protein [Ectothiorhodospiraceae bacterium WFHF3C12]|nr:DUF423 domain-containing protein [Ectothiorhodospiraceae bacterium WFHF3C12]
MVIAGAVLGFIGVALGAFGAHGLRDTLEPGRLEIWQTAVLYNLVHALALVAVGVAAYSLPGRSVMAASGWAFLFGTVVFSGSLYVLAVTGIRGLGAITPIGGLGFLAGWLLLAWAAVRT